MAYQIGDKIRLTATFKDINRALIDPDVVRFLVRQPDRTIRKYTFGGIDGVVHHQSLGVYYADLKLTAAEEWWYRWEASAGVFECAAENAVQVEDTAFEDLS
jgi:hypothetical protein